jgi:hypothetical protein
MKVTEPVGIVVGDVTVAVNFTESPVLAGFFDETTEVVVVAWHTVIGAVPEHVAEVPSLT